MKDGIWKIIISILAIFLVGERAYDYATPAPTLDLAPSSYAAPSPRLPIPPVYQDGKESEDVKATEWTLLVTYRVSAKVDSPAALPDGYATTYLYTWPRPVVLYSRREPSLADVKAEPPGLKGETFMASSFEVLSSRKPGTGKGDQLIEPPVEAAEGI
jgi:hypothetical protein